MLLNIRIFYYKFGITNSIITMYSPRGVYVNLLKSQKKNSVEKIREAYMGKNPKLTSKTSSQSQDRSRQPHELSKTDRKRSLNHKIKELNRNSSSSRTNLRLQSKTMKKQKSSWKKKLSVNTKQNYEDDKRKNQQGVNCRLVIINNGKTQKEHFIQVSHMLDIRDFMQKTYPNVQSFTTVPRQLSLEYLFSQEGVCGKFLNGQSIYLKPEKIEQIRSQISLEHFEIIRQIGSGGFSKVFLCRSKIDNKFYAMKMIDKDMIVKNKKHNIIMNERNIMTKTKHPFIIDLKYAFQAQKYIVFIVEYCPGGELFGLIKKYHRLPEDIVRFYIIEIFLGLAYLHTNQVVYRDIKPENILIGIDGHIKIADLGLAKPDMFDGELAYSFCGSPEYMSPEMIMQIGHTYPVDYYCMGALMFELLTGLPPFYSQDPNQIYEAVLVQELSFPEDLEITGECRSLLKALLCKDPKKRLGSLYGTKQILAHPWFGKKNYQNFLDKKVQPPFDLRSIQKINLEGEENNKNKDSLQKVLRDQRHEKKGFKETMKEFYYAHRDKARPQSHRARKESPSKSSRQSKQNLRGSIRKLTKQASVQVLGSKTLRIFNR